MKNKELSVKIKDILQVKTRLTPQEITYHIDGDPALIQVHGVLSTMKKNGTVQEVVSDRIKYYTLVQSCTEVITDSSRNLSKFSFVGHSNMSKGRLALAIIQKYVTDTNPTLKQLKIMFPDEIVKPYGVIQSEVIALELSPDPKRKRYFLNSEDMIRLKKGKVKKVCVTNQWTNDRILKLLEVAKGKLNYQIVRSD